MKQRTLITLALAAAAPLALAACAEDYYGTGYGNVSYGWRSYPYDVWYDNYYGPFYDGYWGTDGFFWYRLFSTDRNYRRGDGNHFYRQPPPNNNRYRDRYREFNGSSRQPPANVRPPNYPGWGTGPNQNQDQNRDRDRDRDRDNR